MARLWATEPVFMISSPPAVVALTSSGSILNSLRRTVDGAVEALAPLVAAGFEDFDSWMARAPNPIPTAAANSAIAAKPNIVIVQPARRRGRARSHSGGAA